MLARIVAFLAAAFLISIVSFGAGMWTTYKDWAPWRLTQQVQKYWRSWRDTGLVLEDKAYSRRPPDAPAAFHTVNDPSKAAQGYWLINRTSPETWLYETLLVGQDGTILHTWPVDYSRMVEGESPKTFPHAVALLADGTLLVNFDGGKGLARLDACGQPIWSHTDQVYHHSLERGTGGYWTWREPNWIGGHANALVRFDPETGEILESIDLIDDIIGQSVRNATLLTIPPGFPLRRDIELRSAPDIFHANDIEELSPELAPAFPMFKAGDLMISLRNINLVAVIDRQTHEILWSAHGPWLYQHDPDFHADGTITVFANNNGRNRSQLLRINPATGEVTDLFGPDGVEFATFAMGQGQLLPNGNWLVTSALQGRVMEVAPSGAVVREVNNVLDADYNASVTHGEFYPPDYLAAMPACQN